MHVVKTEELEKRKQETAAEIRPVRELFSELVKRRLSGENTVLGFPTSRWNLFNHAFGGARPGELITLTADTGIGKTTFALNWLLDTVAQKRPALLISLELPPETVVVMLAQLIAGKKYSAMADHDFGAISGVMEEIPLVYLDRAGPLPEWKVQSAMGIAAEKFGAKFALIDHLDYIQKNREHWQNESYVIGDCVRNLSGTTKRLGLTTLMIAHPAKLNHQGPKRREVGLDELKGSSSIKQESDAVLSLHRPDESVPVSQLRFLKIRHPEFGRFCGGKIRYEFDEQSLRMNEISTAIEWGTE